MSLFSSQDIHIVSILTGFTLGESQHIKALYCLYQHKNHDVIVYLVGGLPWELLYSKCPVALKGLKHSFFKKTHNSEKKENA